MVAIANLVMTLSFQSDLASDLGRQGKNTMLRKHRIEAVLARCREGRGTRIGGRHMQHDHLESCDLDVVLFGRHAQEEMNALGVRVDQPSRDAQAITDLGLARVGNVGFEGIHRMAGVAQIGLADAEGIEEDIRRLDRT